MTTKTPAQLAADWLATNCVILDTETTGLDNQAEICEISIIDASGAVLLDTLVKPVRPIPAEAIAIHGITNDMVADAPMWAEIYQDVLALLAGRCVVIYNAAYDLRLIARCTLRAGVDVSSGLDIDGVARLLKGIEGNAQCAMLTYAEFYGDWDDYRGNYRWQRLTNAADQQGVVIEGKAHRALADCQLTLGVVRAMAQGK